MFPRSFRARLSWFFVVIVILPMVMVTLVLFRLVADSERGKSDARLGQAQTSASELYRANEQRAAAAGREISASQGLAQAIEAGADKQINEELAAALTAARASRVVLELPDGTRFTEGAETGIAGATTTLTKPGGGPAGTLQTAVSSAETYAQAVRNLTGLDAVVSGPTGQIASTLPTADSDPIPAKGAWKSGKREFRVASFTAPEFEGDGRTTIRLLADDRETSDATSDARWAVAALLIAFLILALAFAAGVSRSLQDQIQRLLHAARRMGGGELDVEVPTDGNDDFAALGTEFNAMATQLRGRLEELEAERERLQSAIRRVGESLATGLDRTALLEIVVQTAVDGVGAGAGRASVREAPGGPLVERTSVGEANGLGRVMDAVEHAVLESREGAETSRGDAHALSHPLRPSDGSSKVAGMVSVARRGRPFSAADRDLFNYLAGQASVSIENVNLHESVQRQAVTDELTGLFNHRRFQEVMSIEVERAKRFGQTLGLIMLDLDDFKSVNDQYGHLQGDQVLREVARVLLDTAREIDEPARYGGEEMAVALPQTDLEGAYEFAERLRVRIERLEVPVLHGEGVVRITASVGAAALPESTAADKDALVQAADAALYRAKRLGKNRVMKAG